MSAPVASELNAWLCPGTFSFSRYLKCFRIFLRLTLYSSSVISPERCFSLIRLRWTFCSDLISSRSIYLASSSSGHDCSSCDSSKSEHCPSLAMHEPSSVETAQMSVAEQMQMMKTRGTFILSSRLGRPGCIRARTTQHKAEQLRVP